MWHHELAKGWTVTVSKDGFISVTSQRNEWSVKFLFVTSVSENEVKKSSYKLKNMAIIGQEQLEQVVFFGVITSELLHQ